MVQELIDFENVVYSLNEYDVIFQKLFSITKIIGDAKIPKSAVAINSHTERIELYINPEWFNSLDFNTKQFCLMHEMLHIVLNHLQRASNFSDRTKVNIAQDIVINHAITDHMFLSRTLINNWQQYWWLDTAKFTIPINQVERNGEFEYYYQILQDGQHAEACCKESDNILDLADFFDSTEAAEDLFKKLKIAGNENCKQLIKIITKKLINIKWNNVPLKIKYKDLEDEESWTRENHRVRTKDLVLPSYLEQEKRKKKEVWIFLDVSGSCFELKHDFIRVANTIPASKFIVRKFTFDTQVLEVKNDHYNCGGGTSFRCIAEYIEKSKKYPDNVFVFTDGYGTQYTTKYPERWHWFLSGGGLTTLINPKSKIYSVETLDEIRRDNKI